MKIVSEDNPLKVLLVEDGNEESIAIQHALNEAMPKAAQVHRVATLADTLKVLSERHFDVAILDWSLPDVKGFDGLHSVQTRAPKLPVIFMTTAAEEQAAFDSISLGAQDYLLKDKLDHHVIKRAIQYSLLRKQFEGVLILNADFDMLTGLANRMQFESRLDMALSKMKRFHSNLGVLFLNLARFRNVNETLGHIAGDKLLKEVGSRLTQVLRPYDTAARLEADSFAVLLESLPEIGHCEVVAKKIIKLLEEPFQIFGTRVDVGVSIGISICTSSQNFSREILMQQADAALFKAKSMTGNVFQVYSAALAL